MRSIFTANRNGLVTGASAGIGLELAKALAPRLDSLILVARRVDRLEQLAGELRSQVPSLAVSVLAADLSDPNSVQGLLRQIDENGRPVDILVNNAGLGEFGLFEQSSWSRVREIIEVNIVAMLRLTHHLLPGMIDRGRGAILNIGSGAGYAAMPNAAVYTASKHFVRAFTESLRAQAAGTGITVSEAAPGPVDTEFDRVAGVVGDATPGKDVFRIGARECAADIVRQFERGSPVIFPGRKYRALMRMLPVIPRRLVVMPVRQMADKSRHSAGE